MNKISVNREELIAKIQENLSAHQSELKALLKARATAVIDCLECDIEKTKKDSSYQTPENLMDKFPMPSDKSKDYEVAIDMLFWSEGELVELDSFDFRRYVMNEWDWMNHFNLIASSYRTQK